MLVMQFAGATAYFSVKGISRFRMNKPAAILLAFCIVIVVKW
ncbi:hypothetical protein [Nostoc sp.]